MRIHVHTHINSEEFTTNNMTIRVFERHVYLNVEEFVKICLQSAAGKHRSLTHDGESLLLWDTHADRLAIFIEIVQTPRP